MFNKLSKARTFLTKLFLVLFLFFVLSFFSANSALASTTNGTIDGTDKYAWGENIGWINFGCDNCHVSVTDTGLSGYAWSRQYGWINLTPNTSGVTNNGEGVLSGYAWGRNIGWINFSGVTIDSSGNFSGYATIKRDSSRINFNCASGNSCASADFKVSTDWRPVSSRPNNGSGGGYLPSALPPPAPPLPPTPPAAIPSANPVANVIESILNLFNPPQPKEPIVVIVPKIAPPALNARWNILPVQAIHGFVFAPLPYEIRTLAAKFSELGNTLKSVGVERFTDLGKLTDVTLQIPGLAEKLNQTINNVGVQNLSNINNLKGIGLNVPGLSDLNQKTLLNPGIGTNKIALISGLPVAKFTLAEKRSLPSEFVFARTAGELVDLNVALSIGDQGQVAQTIDALPGKTLKLVVKPISAARSVTGYLLFQSATPRISSVPNPILRESLTASALFSMNGLVDNAPAPLVPVPIRNASGIAGTIGEQKLVLSTFEYTDPNHDGIYTADIQAPSVPGDYQIMTVIDYVDPTLGTRRMTLTAVIDPEGYVFEKNNGKETRIPSAIVSLYYLNLATKKYELWPAKDFQQENPQITDIRGTYSFLVPEGSYYFEVEAPGYAPYQGKAFLATQGGGIHQNIEMKSSQGWLSQFDWKTVLLIVVFLLLVYNLSKDKLSKFLNKSDGK